MTQRRTFILALITFVSLTRTASAEDPPAEPEPAQASNAGTPEGIGAAPEAEPPRVAQAETSDTDSRTFSFEWLSPPREISRSWSASRDTPALGLAIFPRPVFDFGGELAIATLRWPSWALRIGAAALLELEFDGDTDRFHSGLWPGTSSGRMLWRGSGAYYVSVAPNELGHCMCSGCRIEATLAYRHESQHYTGSNSGDAGEDVSNQPYVGDDFTLDLALSQRIGEWYFAERVLGMWFLPESSSYSSGLGVDLHARWLVSESAHPFVSLYGEHLFGDDLRGRVYPDTYRLRALLGVALSSKLGDIMIFASGDAGNRYGVRILTQEATLGLGVRLSVGSTAAVRGE